MCPRRKAKRLHSSVPAYLILEVPKKKFPFQAFFSNAAASYIPLLVKTFLHFPCKTCLCDIILSQQSFQSSYLATRGLHNSHTKLPWHNLAWFSYPFLIASSTRWYYRSSLFPELHNQPESLINLTSQKSAYSGCFQHDKSWSPRGLLWWPHHPSQVPWLCQTYTLFLLNPSKRRPCIPYVMCGKMQPDFSHFSCLWYNTWDWDARFSNESIILFDLNINFSQREYI